MSAADTAGQDEISYWQQLAAQVMANPSGDGSSSGAGAAGALGPPASCSTGGGSHGSGSSGNGGGSAKGTPLAPTQCVADGAAADASNRGGWPAAGAAGAAAARPPRAVASTTAGARAGGSRGEELTVEDLARLRRRHRLPSVPPRPDGTLEADFEIQQVLAAGGQGTVRKALRRADGRPFVIKTVDLSRMTPFDRELQRNEAKALAALQHPNVIRFEAWYQDGDARHLVTEYAEAGDLLGAIKAAATGGGHLEEGQIMAWFVQICLALDQIHSRGILHRDIKCNNVLLSNGVAKVADFGVCKILEPWSPLEDLAAGKAQGGASSGRGSHDVDAGLAAGAVAGGGTSSPMGGSEEAASAAAPSPRLWVRSRAPAAATASSLVGTPQFLPPELVGSKPYGVKADVWGAGCVLYEMAAGRPPFAGSSTPGVFNRILKSEAPPLPGWCSADLRRLAGWLLQKSPVMRPTLAQLFADPFVRRYLNEYSQQLQQNLHPPRAPAAPPPAVVPLTAATAQPAGMASLISLGSPSSPQASTAADPGAQPAAPAHLEAASGACPAAAAVAAAAVSAAFSRARIKSALLPWGLWAGSSGSGASGSSADSSHSGGGLAGSAGCRSSGGGAGASGSASLGSSLERPARRKHRPSFGLFLSADNAESSGAGGGWRIGTAAASPNDGPAAALQSPPASPSSRLSRTAAASSSGAPLAGSSWPAASGLCAEASPRLLASGSPLLSSTNEGGSGCGASDDALS